jgi:hypothetical protein
MEAQLQELQQQQQGGGPENTPMMGAASEPTSPVAAAAAGQPGGSSSHMQQQQQQAAGAAAPTTAAAGAASRRRSSASSPSPPPLASTQYAHKLPGSAGRGGYGLGSNAEVLACRADWLFYQVCAALRCLLVRGLQPLCVLGRAVSCCASLGLQFNTLPPPTTHHHLGPVRGRAPAHLCHPGGRPLRCCCTHDAPGGGPAIGQEERALPQVGGV